MGDHSPTIPPGARAKRRERALETLAILREQFPACFFPLTHIFRPPIKIGIHRDILARLPLPQAHVAEAMRFYTYGVAYLRASTVEGATRLDLDGQPCGAVTAGEATFAKIKLQAIWAKLRARKTSPPPPPKHPDPTPKPESKTAPLKPKPKPATPPKRPLVVQVIRRRPRGAP